MNLDDSTISPTFEPTDAQPGSAAKVEVLAMRAAAGFPLWHPDDKCGPVCLHSPMLNRYKPPKGPHRLGWAFKGWKGG